MHTLFIEDKFVKETRDGFDESFSYDEPVDSTNFKFSKLAVGIYESSGGCRYFTKSDMCTFLAICSNITDSIDLELLNEIILKYDASKLFNQYHKLESIRNPDDGYYTILHSIKFSEVLTAEYCMLFMKIYKDVMDDLFGFVEDKMESMVLGDLNKKA